MAKKKRRAEAESESGPNAPDARQNDVELVNGNPRKKIKKKKKRTDEETEEIPTVSIAVPGSIIDNTQSFELATRVIVFDNKSDGVNDFTALDSTYENESGAAFLVRILRYLETPQYLRRALFPMHNSLRFVGMLPPLDAPHHLRKHEWAPYREGVTLKERSTGSGTLVDVGLSKNIVINQVMEPHKRVTVAMGIDRNLDADLPREIVSSSKPREEAGIYWGYRVRYASNINSVFKDCQFKGGYDHIIGTSEHGQIVNSSDLTIPTFRHLLIAFGGLAGLEESIEEDNNLKGKDVRQVFDLYLNTCPNQGSRTIRTEEAIFISLQYFQEPITRALQRVEL
ncbi:putative methyltransferase C9orf114 isoform X2 [Juglans microcarpa x Juglans regia]|uniref:putative methyltransferase C9orf114 isoform X2 n=1 Tax=Juglans microcarpa x Juglans regia TaxID=2249226 RepID=UPI001B7E272F|nr:putative methyltransferase C9orf114 isoform X2 [Juglans microcarpa x Juglans regia]